jgi:serine phosphatase RsbU (regulator of sigma subunit)
LFVPLLVEGVVKGIISIQDLDRENAYTAMDVRLLQTLANSMSVALENARLFDETQQRNAELAIINSVQEGLASKLDMQVIYELVGEKIRRTFNAQVVNIVTYDRATQLMHGRYFFEEGEVLPSITRPAFGFRKYVVETGRPIVINSDMPRWIEEYDNPVVQGLQPKSAIFIPLVVGEEAMGVISLQNNDQENAFTEADVRLLTTLANSMSVALENARLFDQTQQRNAELAVINSVQEGLASKLDMQSIYNLVGDKIRQVFDAQGVTIATYDPVTNLLHYRYSIQEGERIEYDPMPLSDKGFRPYIVRTGRSLRLDDVETQGADYGAFMLQPASTPVTSKADAPKSWLGVPLLIGNEVRGVVNLYNVDRTHAYSDSDMRLLETLANSMSVALENARLWEQEKLYRKALERELEIGREIQAGFLPETLPLVEGWEIAASLMSAREVAGDFYDVFELPEGTIGLVIADVCDKGVGAALFMTLFRSLIRITASQESYERTGSMNAPVSTAERLQRAISLTNNYIAETHYESGMFATLFFGILDPREGTLTYVNGGHEPPLIIQSGQVRESLCKTGPAVGALVDCCFDVGAVQFHPGEMLIAFTDGAPDAKSPHGEFFGRERLLDIFRQYSQTAAGMVKTVEAKLHGHIDGTTQFDDITLLAVRRLR